MATVEITSVIIHYTVEPEVGVHVRIRRYAGSSAFLEETIVVEEQTLVDLAAAAKRDTWDESDLSASQLPDAVIWGGSEAGKALRGDLKASPDAPVPSPEEQLIAELRIQLVEKDTELATLKAQSSIEVEAQASIPEGK